MAAPKSWKKATATGVSAFIAGFGIEMGWDVEGILAVVAPFLAYILGQGIADRGKSVAMMKDSGSEPMQGMSE